MLISKRSGSIGLAALAVAIALPVASALAESSISGRSPDAIERDAGRGSGDAYWMQRQPTDPPAPIVKAYHAAKDEAVKAYDSTKALVTQPPPPHEPQRSGRAGGFVGTDEINAPGGTHGTGS